MLRYLQAAVVAASLIVAAPCLAIEAPAPPATPPAAEPPAELDADVPIAESETVVPPSAAAGKDRLKAACSGCHAIGAVGESPETAAPPFRVVVQRYAPEDLEESLAEGIVTGHPEMPQVQFDPAAIADVIAYLDALKLVTEP
jgi:mono/diheme cytochrome c family protein